MIKKGIKYLALFLLAISTCINTFVLPASAAGNYGEIIEVLKTLNIADSNLDEESFFADTVVNRAEFAKYIAKLENFIITGNSELYYNDIPKTHYAYDEITAVTKAGLMSGIGNKTFDPEGAMKMEYTFGVFAKVLGCGSIAGSTVEARNVCANLGVLEDVVASNGDLTMGNLFTMMYNALFCEYYTMTADGLEESGDILMYSTHGMDYVKKGYVTAVNGMDINGGEVSEDLVVIDGVEYNKPAFEMEEYLGRYVEFIYKVGKKSDEYVGTLIWVQAKDSDDTLTLNVTPDCEYNSLSGVLTYYDDKNKEETVEIPENITMIYNGQYKESGIKEVFASDRYEVTFVEGDSGEYDLAIVWQYENIVVDYVSTTDMVAFGKNAGEKINLDPDDYEKLEIVGADGSAITVAGVKPGDVLSVYTTSDGKNVKAYVSQNIVSGKLMSANDDIITVNGTEYTMFKQDDGVAIYMGKGMDFYLDINDLVVYYEVGTSDSGLTVGFMVKNGLNDDSEEVLNFKVFTENSTMEKLQSASRVTVNGKLYKGNLKEALLEINGGLTKTVPQMIAYKLNADGEIVQIDTASRDDGKMHNFIQNAKLEPLPTDTAEADWAYYTVGSGQLGRKMAIGTNTKIFLVPDDSIVSNAEEKHFRIGGLAEGIYPDVVSFRTTQEPTMCEQYILVRQNSTSDKLSNYSVMFDKAYKAINSDDEVSLMVRFVNTTGSVSELVVDPDIGFETYGFKRGDLFKYSTNGVTGEISSVSVIYQPEKEILNTVGGPTAEFRTDSGYVHDANNQGIRVGYESGENYDEVLNMEKPGMRTIVIYDKELDEIVVGSYGDLKTYKMYGDDCSMLIYGTNYKRLANMFGYR